MQPFATDTDLLHWEPNLLRDAGAVAQTLLSGTGTIESTSFTIDSGSLLDAQISGEHVIVLDAPISGSFPIVSVDSATAMTLSVLHDQIGADGFSAWTPGAGSGIGFAIRTFWPQRRIVSELLSLTAGVDFAHASRIINPEALRRPCVLGSLQMIYTALAAASEEPGAYLVRAEMYERLYRRALRATRVDVDLDDDGHIDVRRSLNVLQLTRE